MLRQQEMRLAPVVLTMPVLITTFPSLRPIRHRRRISVAGPIRGDGGALSRAVMGSDKMMTASQGSDDGGGGHGVSRKRDRGVNDLFILRG